MTKKTKQQGNPNVVWAERRLFEICDEDRNIVAPGSLRATDLTYLGLENVRSETGEIVPTEEADPEAGKSMTFEFNENHVLYGKLRPYLNKVALPNTSGRCTTEIIPLLPKPDVDREFLAYYLRREETVATAMRGVTGSRMPRANLKELFQLQIPLPDLPTQRRIAAQLREQMTEVTQVREALEKQLSAAKGLPAACLRAVFEGEEARGWPCIKLLAAADISSGVTLGRNLRERSSRTVSYLRVANVKDGALDLTEVKQTEATEREITSCRLIYGDILLTEGGDPDKLGRGTFWKDEIPECITQNHVFRVRFDLNSCDPRFLAWQFGSPYGKAYFLVHAKQTTGIATINKTVLGNFPLQLPDLPTQRRIADRLTKELATATEVQRGLEAQLQAIKQLPAALLRKVFTPSVA
jgi:type I restriction enzyme S subunit